MGCNLNQISQCTSKCDCGNLNTLMLKGNINSEIESDKQKKLKKLKKYNDTKNIFQIIRENDSNNIILPNISENNNTNKEEKNLILTLNNENKTKKELLDKKTFMSKENKIKYINNCMNNVTIEGNEKNDDNSSIYENNKDSFLNMENDADDESEKKFDEKLQCSNIEQEIEKSLEDIKNINSNRNIYDEDLNNLMNLIDKGNGCENEIIFEGEKCIFNGKLDDKINICGKGKINLKDGRIYEGTFINGKLEGKGNYINNKGDVYIGNFSQGILNGKGTIIKKMENNNKSNGGHDEKNEKNNDMMNNKENNLENNLIYEGEIKNFMKEGYGTEKCPEYNYEGYFKKKKKNGQGSIIYLKQGRKYKGEFKNNEITGKGLLTYENNQTYQGELVNGKKEGKGIYTWPDGSEFIGEYKNDVRIGEGTFKMPNGVIFKGKFVKGKPDGKGIFMYNNKITNGVYKKGKLMGNMEDIYKQLKINIDENNKK